MAENEINEESLVVLDETPAQPNLPTPAEVIAAEKNLPAPAETKETEEEKEPAPAQSFSEEVLATIELKLKAGEELTDEEKAVAAKIEEEIKEPEQPKETAKETIFKIGKEELTASQVEEKMRAELNLGKLDLSAEAKERMLQMYVKAQNRSEAQVSVAKGFEENARTREALAVERAKLEQVARSVAESEQRLEAKRVKLSRAAQNPVELKDVYDELGRVDVVKLEELRKKNDAIDQLNEINEELEALKQQKSGTQREVRVAMANEFAAAHPEFSPESASITEIATKINQGLPVDPLDEMRVLELTRLMDEAASRGLTLEKIYSIELARGTLAVKPVAQPTKEAETKIPKNLPKPTQTLEQKIAAVRARMSKASADTSSPGVKMPPQKPTKAAELIRIDQDLLGNNTSDPFIKQNGY